MTFHSEQVKKAQGHWDANAMARREPREYIATILTEYGQALIQAICGKDNDACAHHDTLGIPPKD